MIILNAMLSNMIRLNEENVKISMESIEVIKTYQNFINENADRISVNEASNLIDSMGRDLQEICDRYKHKPAMAKPTTVQ